MAFSWMTWSSTGGKICTETLISFSYSTAFSLPGHHGSPCGYITVQSRTLSTHTHFSEMGKREKKIILTNSKTTLGCLRGNIWGGVLYRAMDLRPGEIFSLHHNWQHNTISQFPAGFSNTCYDCYESITDDVLMYCLPFWIWSMTAV